MIKTSANERKRIFEVAQEDRLPRARFTKDLGGPPRIEFYHVS